MATESKAWKEFCEANSDDVACGILERICEVIYGNLDASVSIIDRVDHDVINCTCSGEILIDGEWIYFVIENGNWNGTVILEWGEDDPHVNIDREPVRHTLLPECGINKQSDPFAWFNYLRQRKAAWFPELLGKYLYDRHFAPGGKTEEHWQSKLKEKNLRLGEMEEFEELNKMARGTR